jgi:hypothetical protein
MTQMTATYELQRPLNAGDFRALGRFSNTYGIRGFRVDDKVNHLHVDYDASRLQDNIVEHVLREARIPVVRRLEPSNN